MKECARDWAFGKRVIWNCHIFSCVYKAHFWFRERRGKRKFDSTPHSKVLWSQMVRIYRCSSWCSFVLLASRCEALWGAARYWREKNVWNFLQIKINILMICFFADLLFLLKVFQKKPQCDSLTIVDIELQAETFHKSLDMLSTSPLLGRWEEAFKERLNE